MSIFEPTANLGRVNVADNEFKWGDAPDPASMPTKDRSNLAWFFSLIAIALSVLVFRLIFLQVTNASDNQLLAQGNRIRNVELLPSRGIITDRFDTPLSFNVPAFSLEVTPNNLPLDQVDREEVISRLTQLKLIGSDQLEELRKNFSSSESIVLARNITPDQALEYKVRFQDDPGIEVVEKSKREYLRASGLAHLLGYIGKVDEDDVAQTDIYTYSSEVGRAGLEQVYEQELQGRLGYQQVEVDSVGNFQRQVGLQESQPGQTLKLSLDLELQKKSGEVLQAKLTEVESNSGVVIIQNPQTGEILTMVSLPDYDNNIFTTRITEQELSDLFNNPDHLLTNRAIAGTYPSGSVIKPFMAVAGLAEGVITENTIIDAPAQIEIGEFVFPDWKRHGIVDVKRALAVSSNVFFYAVGGGWDKISGLGAEKIGEYLELFGFGTKTQIDLLGEVEGLVPSPTWKAEVKNEAWYKGDTYHLAIGQGDLLVTPLQVLNATSAIANGGTLHRPSLVMNRDHDPIAVTLTDKLEAIRVVRDGMRQTVLDGSARQLQTLPVSSAAKTGTAQFGIEDKTHAWFTAFAPYETPEISIVVLIDGGGSGSEIAQPVANEILNWYFTNNRQDD